MDVTLGPSRNSATVHLGHSTPPGGIPMTPSAMNGPTAFGYLRTRCDQENCLTSFYMKQVTRSRTNFSMTVTSLKTPTPPSKNFYFKTLLMNMHHQRNS